MIIERMEDGIAVLELEDGSQLTLPKELLPTEAKEGDKLVLCIDKEATEQNRQAIQARMQKLFRD